MKRPFRVIDNYIGYFKHGGVSCEDFPLAFFMTDLELLRDHGHTATELIVKYYTGDSPLIIPGWIVEHFGESDGSFNPDVFTPRQKRVMGDVITRFANELYVNDKLKYQNMWREITQLFGEDIEVDFMTLMKHYKEPEWKINRHEDEVEFYECITSKYADPFEIDT